MLCLSCNGCRWQGCFCMRQSGGHGTGCWCRRNNGWRNFCCGWKGCSACGKAAVTALAVVSGAVTVGATFAMGAAGGGMGARCPAAVMGFTTVSAVFPESPNIHPMAINSAADRAMPPAIATGRGCARIVRGQFAVADGRLHMAHFDVVCVFYKGGEQRLVGEDVDAPRQALRSLADQVGCGTGETSGPR